MLSSEFALLGEDIEIFKIKFIGQLWAMLEKRKKEQT